MKLCFDESILVVKTELSTPRITQFCEKLYVYQFLIAMRHRLSNSSFRVEMCELVNSVCVFVCVCDVVIFLCKCSV